MKITPKAKTTAQRQADRRAKMRAAGFVQNLYWVHPDDLPKANAYMSRLLKARLKDVTK